MTAALRFFSDHIEHVIGGLVVLFLLTSILLLIRNINSSDGQTEHGAGDASRSSTDDLDIGAIEAAMKRVLAAQGLGALTVAAGAGSATSDSAKTPPTEDLANADSAQLTQAIQERDSKLQELAREIDRLNTEVSTAKAAPAAGAGGGDGKVSELQSKIEELQARLSEYEIIEDDIADLSLFKEENAQLKAELERLRAESTSAPVAVAAEPVAAMAPVTTDEAPITDSEAVLSALVEEAQEIAAKVEPAPAPVDPGANPAQAGIDDLLASMGLGAAAPAAPAATAAPERDPAKLVSQEDIDRLFALAPTEAKAPAPVEAPTEPSAPIAVPETEDASKLAATADELSAIANPVAAEPTEVTAAEVDASLFDATLDTEKMLSEVEALGDGGDGEDVLSGSLDTEKLLAEMSGIETPDKKTPAAPAPAPAPAAPFNPEEEDSIGEDDLLAEFKDPTDGGQR